MTKDKVLPLLKTYGLIVLGSAVYAVGFNWCYQPNSIAYGGVTGIAQIINFLIPGAPIGIMVMVMNIPLFLLGWKFIGGGLLVSSLFAMAVSSAFIDLLNLVYVFPPMDPMLGAVFGGVLMGVSLGMIFAQGSTTGGTDLLARLLKLRLPWLPMGKLVMAVDLVVIVSTAIVFRSLRSALYGLVALYITSVVIDQVLYGMDTAKVAYIISDRWEEITKAIIQDLDRGVTILHGQGAYSGSSKNVLMCAFRQRQIVRIKQLVKEADPGAFLIVCPAHEVLGDGFRAYSSEDL